MSGHAAHFSGRRVVHLAAETRAIGAPLRRGNAVDCQTVKQGKISRVPHLQRSIHVGFAKGIQGLARNLLHEMTQENEINVGINEPGVGRMRGLLIAGQFQGLVGTAPSAATQTGAQSRSVRQNLPHRNGLLAVGGEGREVMGQGLLWVDAPALNQPGHRWRRGQHLGQRGSIINRVQAGRLQRWIHRAVPIGPGIHHPVALQPEDSARATIRGDGLHDGPVDGRELLTAKNR